MIPTLYQYDINTIPVAPIKSKRLPVSLLSEWYWCSESCYIRFTTGLKKKKTQSMIAGKQIHKLLIPANAKEVSLEEITETLEMFRQLLPIKRTIYECPLSAKIADYTIIGIADEIYYDCGEVLIKEIKTKKEKCYPVSYPDIFQLEIYAWQLSNMLNNVSITGKLLYVCRETNEKMTRYEAVYDKQNFKKIEHKIRHIIQNLENGTIIPPKKWKCNYCEDVFKSKCRILYEQKNLNSI